MLKIISIFLSIITGFFSFFNIISPKNPVDDMQIVTMKENGSDVALFDECGNEVSEDIFIGEPEEENNSLPASYDARDDGLVTAPKVQGNTGCCWAFAAISAAETNMIKKGLADTSVDYSEAHLVWFGLRTLAESRKDTTYGDGIYSDSPFEEGGNWCRSLFALARWSGVQTEQNVPFDGFPFPEGNYPESMRYDSYAHLQASQYIPETDRDSIKQVILDCGSITTSYYHVSTFLNETENNGVCYYQKSVKNTNHTVAVIGWDDNYSRDNFLRTPEGDGAWLIKNSWGSTKKGGDYLWISYYDTSLSYFVTFEMESADNYDNINQYDGFGYKGWGHVAGYNQMSMANIFKTNAKETVRAVSFHTVQPDVNYIVEIYKDIPNAGKPTDGTLASTQSGYMKHRGYITVPLDAPVSLDSNTRYAAVVTLTAPEGTEACIPLEFPVGFDGASDRTYYAKTGQSYLTINRSFDEWEDTAEQGYNNVCIKTFTDSDSLYLKDTSDYAVSGDFLGFVDFGTDENEILSDFKNKNIEIADGFVYLYDENGQTVDSLEIVYLGDVDFDGDLDYDDYSLLSRYVSGCTDLSEKALLAGNLDRNRHTNSVDVTILIQLIYNGGKL